MPFSKAALAVSNSSREKHARLNGFNTCKNFNWYFERNYLPLSQISFSICRVDPNCRIGIGEGFSKFPKLHTQNQFGCRSSLYLVEAGGTLEEVFLCGFAGTVQDNGLVKSSQGSVIVLIHEKTASLLELRLCLHCLLFVA